MKRRTILKEELEKLEETSKTPKVGIMDALNRIQEIPEAMTSDQAAYEFVERVIYAMKNRQRQAWPDKQLRKIVNQLDPYQRKLLYETLIDIKEGLDEYFQSGVSKVD